MSEPTVQQSEMTHTDFVEERVQSEEEEDIFFETEEPEIPGQEVTVDLGTAQLKDKPSQSALTQVSASVLTHRGSRQCERHVVLHFCCETHQIGAVC